MERSFDSTEETKAIIGALLDALRTAQSLIELDIVRDDAGCLLRIRAAIAEGERAERSYAHDAHRALFAELLATSRAVVAAERDGGISQADLWRIARECANTVVSKVNANRYALSIEVNAWCKEEGLPELGDPNEVLVLPGMTPGQIARLTPLLAIWRKATWPVHPDTAPVTPIRK